MFVIETILIYDTSILTNASMNLEQLLIFFLFSFFLIANLANLAPHRNSKGLKSVEIKQLPVPPAKTFNNITTMIERNTKLLTT